MLEGTMRLLHPFMPFISEEIWQHLPRKGKDKALITSSWPKPEGNLSDKQARMEMNLVMQVIRAIRNLRSEIGFPVGKKAAVILRAPAKYLRLLYQEEVFIKKLAWAEGVTFIDTIAKKPPQALTAIVDEIEVYLPWELLI